MIKKKKSLNTRPLHQLDRKENAVVLENNYLLQDGRQNMSEDEKNHIPFTSSSESP